MVKLALNKYPELLIVNCETNSEHLDNKRFDSECESWWNKKITRLNNPKYKNVDEVYEKTRYMSGIAGARCTTELRKKFQD